MLSGRAILAYEQVSICLILTPVEKKVKFISQSHPNTLTFIYSLRCKTKHFCSAIPCAGANSSFGFRSHQGDSPQGDTELEGRD